MADRTPRRDDGRRGLRARESRKEAGAVNNLLIGSKALICMAVALIAALPNAGWSQSTKPVVYPPPNNAPAPTNTPAAKSTTMKSDFKPEEIDAIVAPIALYPDPLLAQVFMASTYPVEVVQAERWVKQNKDLKGDALAQALEKQTWDPSVRSLIQFPEVLTMMSDKLDWTVKLGDAFIANQKGVMDAIQKLRAKAQTQGSLSSNDQMTVTSTPAPAGSSTTQNITI